jgi:hypothetical protein
MASSAVSRPIPTQADNAQTVVRSLSDSFRAAAPIETPYRHWLLHDVLPPQTWAEVSALPFPAPDPGDISGSREVHNDTRVYFDAANNAAFPVCGRISEALQSPEAVELVQRVTGSDLSGCCLRVEYAQDIGHFWLRPHTDLGVKRFTMLLYLADSAGQEDLGTDIYADADTWAARPAFVANTALVFKPSNNTWHGFAPRPIPSVRKSIIINYVTEEWRAREQLAYPDTPVLA